MKNNRKIIVSVIGGHATTDKVVYIAHEIGKIVAKMEAVLVCGGLTGVMEAVSKGAAEAGGLIIGLLPGVEKADANPYVNIPITTTIGFARNAMVACSADVIIALPGSHGTSSEISYGLVYKKPIIDFGNWNREGMIKVNDLKELEGVLANLINEIRSNLNG